MQPAQTHDLQARPFRAEKLTSTCWKKLSTGDRDAVIEWAVLKSVAGFMNNRGGTLLVGVGDDGRVLGIEEDFRVTGGKHSTDDWGLRLGEVLNRTLGKAAATDVHVTYAVIDGRTVARIAVRATAQPVSPRQARATRSRPSSYGSTTPPTA